MLSISFVTSSDSKFMFSGLNFESFFRISKLDETIETEESKFASVDIEYYNSFDSYLSSRSSINSDSYSDSTIDEDEQSDSDYGSENSDVEYYFNVLERILLNLRDIYPHPHYTYRLALLVVFSLLFGKVVLEVEKSY